MDAEDKKKLDRVLALAEENNAYIRKVRSSQRTSQVFKAVYWVFIIIFVLGGFYFVQPYLRGFQFNDATQVQKIIDQFKQQQTK